jgi:hypothetical protein
MVNRKQKRSGMYPDRATLKADKKGWDKHIIDERREWLKAETDKARHKSDDELGILAVQILGRKIIWHLVKRELREKALGIE